MRPVKSYPVLSIELWAMVLLGPFAIPLLLRILRETEFDD